MLSNMDLTTVTTTSSEPMKTQSKETVEASGLAICWKNRSDQAAFSGHIVNPHIRTLFVMILVCWNRCAPDVNGADMWWKTNVTLNNNHKRHCYIHAADGFTPFLTPSTKTQRSFLKPTRVLQTSVTRWPYTWILLRFLRANSLIYKQKMYNYISN